MVILKVTDRRSRKPSRNSVTGLSHNSKYNQTIREAKDIISSREDAASVSSDKRYLILIKTP